MNTWGEMPEHPVLLPRRETMRRTGLSKSQIHRLEARGEFPARVKQSEASVAFFEHEVTAWILSRIRAGGRRMPAGCRGADPTPKQRERIRLRD